MKRIACIALALFATAAAAATLTYPANPGDTVIINVAPAPGGGGGGPLVCPPGQQPNATGTACEPIPPVDTGTCAGFTTTVRMELDWANPQRLYTANAGGFGIGDVLVIKFTTGSASTTNSLPRIAAAEYNSSPSPRIAVLSAKPCDFGPQATPGATINGNSVTAVFAIGTGTGFGYYPILQTNTTYYLNVKNSANATCAFSGICNMFVDLVKVGGL